MQLVSQGFHYGAQLRLSDSAQAMRQEMAQAAPSRGERLVARLDRDGDGAIGVAELQGTKLGRRMNVDRFARLDGNGDGALDAGEIDAGRGRGRRYGHSHPANGPGMMESVVRSNYAEFLAQRSPEADDGPADVAAQVIGRLDADGSGALNSEEIAGTRLAGLIGDGFYGLDADRNGALDRGEVTGFVTDHLLGTPAAAPDVAEEAATEGPDISAGAEVAEAAWTAAAAPAASGSAAEQSRRIASAFETALEILRNGPGSSEPYDVVQALYGDVKSILGAS